MMHNACKFVLGGVLAVSLLSVVLHVGSPAGHNDDSVSKNTRLSRPEPEAVSGTAAAAAAQDRRRSATAAKSPCLTGEVVLKDFTKLKAVRDISGVQTKWDDPDLIELIHRELLDSPRIHVTKLSFPLYRTPQADAVNKILHGRSGGFFVECGALDGERSSNTIWLEKKKGWTGLLVEMDPSYYLQILGKNRKAYSSNVCLSTERYPMIVNFKEHYQGSGRLTPSQKHGPSILPTFCVPFYSMMLAMNRTKIDYLSLDVEGFEMPILRTIPFDKLSISVLTVEYVHGQEQSQDGADDYVRFMTSQGYIVHSKIDKINVNINLFVHDYVFVKSNL